MAAVVGDDVVISCSSDKDRSNSSWTRFADDGRVELFDSGHRKSGVDRHKFKMNSSDRGRLDLIVEEAGVEDAGLYVCEDGDEHASAHLLIVTSSPTCSLSSGRELCAIVLVVITIFMSHGHTIMLYIMYGDGIFFRKHEDLFSCYGGS